MARASRLFTNMISTRKSHPLARSLLLNWLPNAISTSLTFVVTFGLLWYSNVSFRNVTLATLHVLLLLGGSLSTRMQWALLGPNTMRRGRHLHKCVANARHPPLQCQDQKLISSRPLKQWRCSKATNLMKKSVYCRTHNSYNLQGIRDRPLPTIRIDQCGLTSSLTQPGQNGSPAQ